MRKNRFWTLLGCCLLVVANFAGAQAGKPKIESRPAGLWEVSTTMTWQQSPFMPGEVSGMPNGGTHTKQVCLTSQMIEEYGVLLPQSRGQCHLENKAMVLGGMTADWVCAGNMPGKGALETRWTDLEHEKGKVHFVGTFQAGTETRPVEWTTESDLTFKGSDCGMVKPLPLPGAKH